ncbi:MAG: NADH:flavin oxidoreductase [Caulobacterales bacterium]|jgi:2,4-dienoyl-CoA reductase-like NADH-dependent reductase (Old Yellow Enzyme family)
MSEFAPLFQPFTCRGLTIANRIAMAPMTRSFSPDGIPGQNVVDYYARRAAHDVGLIISEGTSPDRAGASFDANVPNFHTQQALAGWRKVVDAVHAANGKMAPQIWHVGMMRKQGAGPNPQAPSDSPSGLTHTGKPVYDEPTEEDVQDMAESYARAAANAAALGFDAVEIHGAHGYLIDEFFWDRMNVRSDKYGGSIAKRSAFAAEVVRLTRAAIGDNIPIILRFSQWKQQDYAAKLTQNPAEMETFLQPMVDAGVDIFHASQRKFWEAEFPDIDGPDGLNTAGWVKKITGLPTITVGSVGLSSDFVTGYATKDAAAAATGFKDLMARFNRGDFDMVAIGRALLQDPEWATKVKEGRLSELTDYSAEALKTLY